MTDRVYTVVRQIVLTTPIDESWRCLVDGKLITAWFACSSDLAPGGSFTFRFGDGDFFNGFVTEWNPPVSVGLEWRFLDVGPRFDIRFSLLPVDGGTELTVQDRGSASVAEAMGLREGWDDFIMRLERFTRTKENCRYRWTEVFGATAVLKDADQTWGRIAEPAFLRTFFPSAEISLHDGGAQRFCLQFGDPAWGELHTEGEAAISTRRAECCLNVTHRGWGGLPMESQVSERRRYAEGWAALLKNVETWYESAKA